MHSLSLTFSHLECSKTYPMVAKQQHRGPISHTPEEEAT
jgi:hypothetical protein